MVGTQIDAASSCVAASAASMVAKAGMLNFAAASAAVTGLVSMTAASWMGSPACSSSR